MENSAAVLAHANPTGVHAPRRRSASILLGLAVVAAAALLPSAAEAACKGGFCVSGRDENGGHVVDFTTTWTNISHFNYSDPWGKQTELGANQTEFVFLNGVSGQLETFGLQACSGGGTFTRSRCTPWVYFNHTVP